MIADFTTLNRAAQNLELTEKFQKEMNTNFLEHAMYDVNDALASILALCDMEQMKNIPKVKGYIQHINKLLNLVQVYQDEKKFSVNHVLRNVMNIITHNYKGKVNFNPSMALIKAFVESSQSGLERLLLFIFIELVSGSSANDKPQDIYVELTQKEQDAHIIIRKNNYSFSASAMKEFDKMREDFSGYFALGPKGGGVEINIKLPLSFKESEKISPLMSNIKITGIKHKISQIKSFMKKR